jgi:F-type H+-transporting ATPase subunit b
MVALDAADEARDEARGLLEQHRALIADARSQSERILADARADADAQRDRVRTEAGADLERRLEENRREIEAENRRLVEQIRREVVELTLIASEKVTGKVLDADDQRRLIDEAVGEIDFDRLASRN